MRVSAMFTIFSAARETIEGELAVRVVTLFVAARGDAVRVVVPDDAVVVVAARDDTVCCVRWGDAVRADVDVRGVKTNVRAVGVFSVVVAR